MKRNVERLRDETFDLLVIGGGVYGAWSAYDAALRGLRVAIVEQADWAAGTSSASSKLIHGGLRYLEYRKFSMVRRTLLERNRLRQLAPHRVRRLRFAIPIYRGGLLTRLKLRLGLSLYDLIAGTQRPLRGHESLSATRMAQRYDCLKRNGLKAGFTYGDCQTDDARFTLELIAGALQAGAVAVNRVAAIRLSRNDAAITGAFVEDRVSGDTFAVAARCTALCAGAWNEALLNGAAPEQPLKTRLSKGVHLVMPRLPTDDAFLLMTGERGRVVFMIPWNGRTLLGTTDTPFADDPASARVLPPDEDYLLAQANAVLDDLHWSREDVIGRFSGLRTFPDEAGDPASLSREWSMATPVPGAIVSVGGKLTSARADAAKLVAHVCKQLDRDPGPCPTTWRPFPWRPEGRYRAWQRQTLGRGLRAGLDEETVLGCQLRYGARIDALFDMIEKLPELARRFVSDAPICLGELAFCAQREMVSSLEDLLRRRLPLLLITQLPERRIQLAAAIAGKLLDWSPQRQADEVQAVLAASGDR